ncbi:MAG: protein kinase [Lachnospiraceae bacterium]|nr:protein kinase [Lachnospiraceae bacterium]
MLKNGVFLQNRYEIISRIGSGGMADVYKARDHKLNRFVAIKVLKSEFRDDKSFLSKFRVEAQAAAGLAHSNIVNVYDVGEDRGASFIVMELVEGITLKAYIGKKGRLSVREATSIALQVAAGLEAAHNNGIIHRDVKPQNIIISLDGKAKIADFGIARAATSDTISSSAMGSVHYCAPEQTRGGYCDAKSDIYAMGVTMFEMLTGRLPFEGDTTVEVALRHLQEDTPSPRKFASDLPLSTEKIVLKCMQKSPDRRYSNMGELIRDLKESLVNPDGDFVTIRDVDQKTPTVMLSKEDVSKIRSSSGMPSYDTSMDTGAAGALKETQTPSGDSRMYPYGGTYYQSSGYQDLRHSSEGSEEDKGYIPDPSLGDFQARMDYPGSEDEGSEDDPFEYEKRKNKKGRRRKRKDDDDDGSGNPFAERLITAAGIAAAVIAALVILYFVGRAVGLFGKNTVQPETGTASTETQTQPAASQDTARIAVPEIRGYTEAEAQKLLREQGLGYKYQGEISSAEYAKGLVVNQSVEPGTIVDRNTMIGYLLSSGVSETLNVPDVSGSSREEAEKALKSLGLTVQVDNTRYSNTVNEGYVITTNPGAGSPVASGDMVTIYISQGPDSSTVKMPKLVDHYVDDASVALNNLGLYVYTIEVYSDTVEKGIVISQDVPADSVVQTGTTVTITVSAGPEVLPDAEILDTESKWVCNVQLNAPDIWEGEPVRIDLEQNGEKRTIFEGNTTFPYVLNVEGKPGVATGTAYVYIIDSNTWNITSTTMYSNISFYEEDS